MVLKSLTRRLCDGLTDLFNAATMRWPNPKVQDAMKKDGWHFDVICPPAMRGGSVSIVLTPEGHSAFGIGAAKTERERFVRTVAEKSAQLGLKP